MALYENTHLSALWKSVAIDVWLANMRPETRWAVGTYGLFLDKAT